MIARVAAKGLLIWLVAWICAALIFIGIGLIGFAIAVALSPAFGIAGGAALAGAIFVLPPLFWAVLVAALRPRRSVPPKAGTSEYLAAIFAGLAKEPPWMAIAGTGLALVAEVLLKLRRRK